MKTLLLSVILLVSTVLPVHAAPEQDRQFRHLLETADRQPQTESKDAYVRTSWQDDVKLARWYCEQRQQGVNRRQLIWLMMTFVERAGLPHSQEMGVIEGVLNVFAAGTAVYCPETYENKTYW